ncbi:MAG: hypothetical protein NTX88_00065, partial [Candidatus Atribacteria bacterium]|nr:hypothetical protein [Candidatus Atribacteria bacterium]
MTSFFLILSMVSLVFLIIGLVNPGLVIFRGRKRRFLVITIYGSIALLSLFLLILLAPPSRNQANVALVQTPLPAGQGGNGASSPPGSTASPQPALESGPLMNEPIHYPSEFTEISTTMVTWFEGTLNIVGETDLPDGAVIEAMVRP